MRLAKERPLHEGRRRGRGHVFSGSRGRVGGRDRDEGGAEVADLREQAVQLRLVDHDAAQGGGPVVLVGDLEAAEPARPVPVEVLRDAELVRRGAGVHDGAPTGSRVAAVRGERRRAGRRMAHSATARLITQPAPLARSAASTPVPKIAPPKPSVKAWVPAARPIAYARIIHARWAAMSRRRTAVKPSTRQAAIADPKTRRST